jgi:hypothetical protein
LCAFSHALSEPNKIVIAAATETLRGERSHAIGARVCRKSWPRHFDCDRSALLLPIEQYEHPQPRRAFIKGKQGFRLAFSILADHID